MSERDLRTDEPEGDPGRAHGEFLLSIFDQEKRRQQDSEFLKLLNDAHRLTRQDSEGDKK